MWHHKGFYLAVRWLMSLEPWQSIKCYNLIVSSAIPHPPPGPLRFPCAKRENWGNKIDVKKNRLWLGLRDYTNKTNKQKHRREEENNHTKCYRDAYVLIHTCTHMAEDVPVNDMPLRTSKSTKSVLTMCTRTLSGAEIVGSHPVVILIATKIIEKYHCNDDVSFPFFSLTFWPLLYFSLP